MLARDIAPRAEIAQIARVHPLDYIEALRSATPLQGHVAIDQDTSMNPVTFEAALRSAGGAIFAVDEVMTRKDAQRVRRDPPARTSRRDRRRRWASASSTTPRSRPGTRGRLTAPSASQSWTSTSITATAPSTSSGSDPNVMYASTHEMPNYPGTGSIGGARRVRSDRQRAAEGWRRRATRSAKRWRRSILPRIDDFAPDLVIISAGFDAHRRDPLGNLNFVEADFVWATRKLMEIAQKRCGGRVVSVLEGGYDLDALARSVGGARDDPDGGLTPPPRRSAGRPWRESHTLSGIRT